MTGGRRKPKASTQLSTVSFPTGAAPANRRVNRSQPTRKYAPSSSAPAAQIKPGRESRAAASCAAGATVRDGNGVRCSEICAAVRAARLSPAVRFQTLSADGSRTGSSSRNAAAHHSAGNSARGSRFPAVNRSSAITRIITLPLTAAAWNPLIPPAPPPAHAGVPAPLS